MVTNEWGHNHHNDTAVLNFLCHKRKGIFINELPKFAFFKEKQPIKTSCTNFAVIVVHNAMNTDYST